MKFLGFRPLSRWIGCSTDCLITDHPYSDSFPSPTEVDRFLYQGRHDIKDVNTVPSPLEVDKFLYRTS